MAAAIPNRSQFRKDKFYVDKVWDKCHDFFDNERYTDVTFLWRRSLKRVTAHRLILAAASAFFDELFQTSRGMAPAIYMEDIAPEPFELLIAYCYSGKLYPRNQNVIELLNAATILQLDGAAAICAAYLKGGTKGPRTGDTAKEGCSVTDARNTNLVAASSLLSDVTRAGTSKTAVINTNRMKKMLVANSPAAGSSQVLNSILAVRKCDLQTDNESCLYRFDETEKKWLQYGVLTVHRKFSDFAYSNKSLVSVGGLDNGRPTNSVDSYNLKTQTWQPLPPMQTARSDVCVAKINEVIYAIGGSDAESRPCSTVEKLDLNKRSPWVTLPAMLTPRRNATAVAVGELIYVLGGIGKDWKPLRSVECYNIRKLAWTKCADMHDARHDCGASILKGLIYVLGSGNLPPYSLEVECYDPRFNIWTKVAPLNVARSGISGVTFCEQVFAVGGFLPNYFKGVVEKYDPTQNAWLKTMALPAGGNYKCFIVPTEELADIEKARKRSISLTPA